MDPKSTRVEALRQGLINPVCEPEVAEASSVVSVASVPTPPVPPGVMEVARGGERARRGAVLAACLSFWRPVQS